MALWLMILYIYMNILKRAATATGVKISPEKFLLNIIFFLNSVQYFCIVNRCHGYFGKKGKGKTGNAAAYT